MVASKATSANNRNEAADVNEMTSWVKCFTSNSTITLVTMIHISLEVVRIKVQKADVTFWQVIQAQSLI